jgi:hypothetical protein
LTAKHRPKKQSSFVGGNWYPAGKNCFAAARPPANGIKTMNWLTQSRE